MLKSIVAQPKPERKSAISELTVHDFKEGVEIWENKDIRTFFFQKSMNWKPKNKVAVFLPCSAYKPYPYSDSHKDGYLKALLPYLDKIDLFVVSEPMGIVPYCYSDEYPVDSYDYNPYKFFIGKREDPMVEKAFQIFVCRLAMWVDKFHKCYDLRILMLPKSWHLKVFKKALQEIKRPLGEYELVTLSGRAKNSLPEMASQLEYIFKRAII